MTVIVVPISTLFYTFAQTLFVVSTAFDNIFKLLFLIVVACKSKEATEPPKRLFVWTLWTLHSWLPTTTASSLPAVLYPILSLLLFLAALKHKKRFVVGLLLTILMLFDVESRACHFSTVLCIVKTFIFWFDEIAGEASKQAAKIDPQAHVESTAVEMSCLLWSHPLLAPVYFAAASKRLYSAFQTKKKL
jgi:hypothetical protein